LNKQSLFCASATGIMPSRAAESDPFWVESESVKFVTTPAT